MLPPECKECLIEMKTESKAIHEGIRSDLNEQSNTHFVKQEEKMDRFLDKADKRETQKSNFTLLVLTIFASVIGYMYIKQNEMQADISKKIDRQDALTLTEAQLLREQGDRFYDAKYVKKTEIKGDTMTYYLNKQAVWKSVFRGVQ